MRTLEMLFGYLPFRSTDLWRTYSPRTQWCLCHRQARDIKGRRNSSRPCRSTDTLCTCPSYTRRHWRCQSGRNRGSTCRSRRRPSAWGEFFSNRTCLVTFPNAYSSSICFRNVRSCRQLNPELDLLCSTTEID